MIKNCTVTIIIDDSPGKTGLSAEHGLSFWIEADDQRILFDTGQSDMLLTNARKLGIDLATADAVVLSHGHYDHTGGLSSVMELNPTAPVYCHPGVLTHRYSPGPDATIRSIGIPIESFAALSKSGMVRWVSQPQRLGNSISLTGPVPRLTDFEDTGGRFFLDPGMQRTDAIDDDLSMWILTPRGAVVIAGCCHSGIVNTMNYIGQLQPDSKMRVLIGGLHLLNASSNRLEQTLDALRALSLERIVACHCTGNGAIHAMKTSLGNSVTEGTAGMKIIFKA